MSTSYGQNGAPPMGGSVPLIGITQVAGGADVALMNLQTSMTRDRTAQPLSSVSDATHEIGVFDGLIMRNDRFNNNFKMMNTLSGEGSRGWGRPLAIAQTGNLPLPQELLDDPIYQTSTEDEKDKMRRQTTKSCYSYLGIALGGFIKEQGPSNTHPSTGLPVGVDGQYSTMAFTGTPIPPFVPICWDLIASQQIGRNGVNRYQSDGPSRYPITYRQHDPHNPTKWIETSGRSYTARMKAAIQSKNPKWPGYKMLNANSSVSGKRTFMLESDSNTCKLVMGMMGILYNFIALELADAEASSAPPDEVNTLKNTLGGLLQMLLATDVEQPKNGTSASATDIEKGRNRVLNLCRAAFEGSSVTLPAALENQISPGVKTLQKSALALLTQSIQDTAASTNTIIGRTLGLKTGDPRSKSGVYNYTLLLNGNS